MIYRIESTGRSSVRCYYIRTTNLRNSLLSSITQARSTTIQDTYFITSIFFILYIAFSLATFLFCIVVSHSLSLTLYLSLTLSLSHSLSLSPSLSLFLSLRVIVYDGRPGVEAFARTPQVRYSRTSFYSQLLFCLLIPCSLVTLLNSCYTITHNYLYTYFCYKFFFLIFLLF